MEIWQPWFSVVHLQIPISQVQSPVTYVCLWTPYLTIEYFLHHHHTQQKQKFYCLSTLVNAGPRTMPWVWCKWDYNLTKHLYSILKHLPNPRKVIDIFSTADLINLKYVYTANQHHLVVNSAKKLPCNKRLSMNFEFWLTLWHIQSWSIMCLLTNWELC